MMSVWIKVYLFVFIFVAISGARNSFNEGYSPWFILGDALNDIFLLFNGLCYWSENISALLSDVSKILCIITAAWFLYSLFFEIKKTIPYEGLLNRGNVFMATSVVFLISLLASPLFYWSFMSAFLGMNSGII